MAVRNSPMRRIPGNPVGGVLRATARAARSTTRRSTMIPGPPGEAGVAGPPGPVAAPVAAVLTCNEVGEARWDYADQGGVPMIVATPVADVPLIATLKAASATRAEFRVWHCDGTPWPGATLHVAAFPAPAEEQPPVDLPEQPTTEGL